MAAPWLPSVAGAGQVTASLVAVPSGGAANLVIDGAFGAKGPAAVVVSVLMGDQAVVPALFYWAMRLSQNVGDRFYFFLPLAAAMLIVSSWQTLTTARKQIVADRRKQEIVELGSKLRNRNSRRHFTTKSYTVNAARRRKVLALLAPSPLSRLSAQ